MLHVAVSAENAFWTWVIVEVLRLGGLRVEEVLELSQLSVRQYARPNGEVIALLVIAPSKTDRERVIPMSAELFHVIAVIIRRLTSANGDGAVWGWSDVGHPLRPDEQSPAHRSRSCSNASTGQRVEVITPGAWVPRAAPLSSACASPRHIRSPR